MKSASSPNLVLQIKDINIGENLRAFRQKKRIRQNEMVTMLQLHGIDVSLYSYNRIEKGTQNPSVSLLITACKLLDCDMNALFGMNTEMMETDG